MTIGYNHCQATGNSQNGSGWAAGGGGPGTDCSVGGANQYAATPGSACSESSETGGVQAMQGICTNSFVNVGGACTGTWYPNTLTPTTAVENYTTGNYSIAKGYMGALSATKVRWRVPTKYDFQQADNDGIRFVMPDQGAPAGILNRPADGSPGSLSPYYEWSASLISNSRANAWSFYGGNGHVDPSARTGRYVVRCLGR